MTQFWRTNWNKECSFYVDNFLCGLVSWFWLYSYLPFNYHVFISPFVNNEMCRNLKTRITIFRTKCKHSAFSEKKGWNIFFYFVLFNCVIAFHYCDVLQNFGLFVKFQWWMFHWRVYAIFFLWSGNISSIFELIF